MWRPVPTLRGWFHVHPEATVTAPSTPGRGSEHKHRPLKELMRIVFTSPAAITILLSVFSCIVSANFMFGNYGKRCLFPSQLRGCSTGGTGAVRLMDTAQTLSCEACPSHRRLDSAAPQPICLGAGRRQYNHRHRRVPWRSLSSSSAVTSVGGIWGNIEQA